MSVLVLLLFVDVTVMVLIVARDGMRIGTTSRTRKP